MRRILLGCLFVLVGADGCSGKKEPAAKKPSQEQKPTAPVEVRGLLKANPRLAKLIRAAAEGCAISTAAPIQDSHCKGNQATTLRQAENGMGIREALLAYCHGMRDNDPKVRALSYERTRQLSLPHYLQGEADPRTFSCLLELITTTRQRSLASIAVRAAGLMAPVLNKTEALVKVLDASELLEVKADGYGALWANGRLRVFEPLARSLRDEAQQPRVKLAIVNGFGGVVPLSDEEQAKVCPLLTDLATRPPLAVASTAANRAANSCAPMYWDKVLDGAEGMLHQTKFDEGFVSAVRTAATNAPRKKRRAFTRRSVTMLIQAVEMKGLDPMTRYQALQALSAVDRKTGARLARLHAESEVPLLRSAAAVVLGSAKTARKK